MMKKLMIRAAALTGASVLPFAAMAQDNGFEVSAAPTAQPTAPVSAATSTDEFSLGFQWLGGKNTYEYGRYNGFTEEGADILGAFDIERRDAWDSGSTWYFDFSGANLNFQTGNELAKGFHDSTYANSTSNDLGPTAEVELQVGNQGTWGITADYDAISYTGNIIDSIYTVNGNVGTLNNGFPAWGGASNNPLTAGLIKSYNTHTLSPAEEPFLVGTRRDILEFSGTYLLDDWTLEAKIRHEHKEGTLEESLRETYGGQAFTLPIDYDTDRLDVTASYLTPDFQAVLQYTLSNFTDNNSGVYLPYPVSISPPLSKTSGPYAQTGLYSTPPSSAAHYVTAMLGDNLAPQTRLTLNARVGVELQDSTFPANSAEPNLSSALGGAYDWFGHLNALNQGTSATSPDDVAWVYQGKFAIDSKLDTDLDGEASYSFDGRSVHLNQYKVWIGGSSPDATANTAAYVVPQDWFKQTAELQGTYRIIPDSNTKVTVSYAFNDIDRTNAQVEHSITNTESIQLISMLGSDILGRLTYEHADRSGSLVYGTAWGNLESGVPEIYDTPSGAYYQAPMTSNSVILRADYAPLGDLSGGLFLKYVDENFTYPAVPFTAPTGDWTLVGHGEGIKEDYNLTIGPDISYRPSKDVNVHIYYTYEKIFFNNLGNGACAELNTGNCNGSAGYFQNKYTSNMNTAGFSGDWQATSDLKLSAEYDMSEGSVIFGEFNGVMVTSVTQSDQNVVPYPDINSLMHQVKLTAAYQFTDHIEVSLLYQFSMFHNNDWDDLTPPVQATTNTGTAISILTPAYPAPNYNVSSVGMVLKVRL